LLAIAIAAASQINDEAMRVAHECSQDVNGNRLLMRLSVFPNVSFNQNGLRRSTSVVLRCPLEALPGDFSVAGDSVSSARSF
jgi:hypothetical protein